MNINATLFVQALSFAALIWFSVRFVWPMITDAMDERTKRIADGLAAAEAGKQSLERSAKQADEAIAQARGRVTEILTQAEKRASQMIEEAKASAIVPTTPSKFEFASPSLPGKKRDQGYFDAYSSAPPFIAIAQ